MVSRRNEIPIQLSKRDVEILHFLWKWKVCTTKALSEKFFSGSVRAGYKRLRLLKLAGYIRLLAFDEECGRFVWTLSLMGFKKILRGMDDLKEAGFASECLEHDLYVTAVHLGDWLMGAPEGVEFVTEQELRRYHISQYPKWVPVVGGRRPDGYWLIPHGQSRLVFALEVELSIKDQKEYGPIGRFYADAESISRVIWLVDSVNKAHQLQNIFKQVSKSEHEKHNFILRPDFEKNGWQSRIIAGYEQNENLKFGLCAGQKSLVEHSVNTRATSNAHFLLNTTKCGLESRGSGVSSPDDFPNSMASQPAPQSALLTRKPHTSHFSIYSSFPTQTLTNQGGK